MATVSLSKSENHFDGVTASLEPFKKELQKKLKDKSQVVIKINFVKTEPELATTPFGAVQAFVEFIQPFYEGEIVITEGASFGNTEAAFRQYGYQSLADKYDNVHTLNLFKDEKIKVSLEYPGGVIELPLSKTVVEAPFLVSITRPKTHNEVVVTLGLKNVAVGAISGSYMKRAKIHRGKVIHNIMVEILKHAYPDFVVLDGTVSMQGDGPTRGTPINSGWALCGFDALAVDSIATYLMGFDVADVGYLNMLREEDLGELYPIDKVKIIGEELDPLVQNFAAHSTFESQRRWN